MKVSEIRELGPEELNQKVQDLKQELFNLRFQHEIGQLDNTAKLKQTKRTIAAVKTIISETASKKTMDKE